MKELDEIKKIEERIKIVKLSIDGFEDYINSTKDIMAKLIMKQELIKMRLEYEGIIKKLKYLKEYENNRNAMRT